MGVIDINFLNLKKKLRIYGNNRLICDSINHLWLILNQRKYNVILDKYNRLEKYEKFRNFLLGTTSFNKKTQ